MIIYHRRPEQRVYTPEEYAAMGYNLRDDYNLEFGTPDAPLKDNKDPFFSYRADSKGEVAKDAIFFTLDVATFFLPSTALFKAFKFTYRTLRTATD